MKRLDWEKGYTVIRTRLVSLESEFNWEVRKRSMDRWNTARLWSKAAWGFWITYKQWRGIVRS